MRCVDEPGRSLRVLRFAALATISVAAVSCSADTQRTAYNPFRSKAPAPTAEVTGSVPQTHSAIQSSPLPPPPNAGAPQTRPVVTGGAGGSKGMASYEPAPAQHSASRNGWNWEGGTAITV